MNVDLVKIGNACKRFRKKHNWSQKKIAMETGYSIQSVSCFENGGTNNLSIFLWYVEHGMEVFEWLR